MNTFLNDLKYGFRIMIKQPLFAAVAILTLALGIGANVTIFGFVNAVLLRPLPYNNSERLVDLTDTHPTFGRMSVSYANYQDWRTMNQTLEDISAYRFNRCTLHGVEGPERIQGVEVNANLFPLLGIKATAGRLFSRDDDHAQATPTVVLSHSFWQQHFGGSPEAIGQSLTMDNRAYTVVGVLPAGFQFPPFQRNGAAFWTPLGLRENNRGFMQRINHDGTNAIGKLKAGVTLPQARADLDRVARQLEQTYPDSNKEARIALNSFREQILGNTRSILTVFMGAVTVVLLIVCVNIANLLLVRSQARSQEFSVRNALGAGRWQMARQLFSENLVLASLGGLGGWVIALGGLGLLSSLLSNAFATARESLYQVDIQLVWFTLAITLSAGLLFGLFPAWQMARTTAATNLVSTARRSTATKGQNRLRDILVMSEISLALVLLCGAGLMVRSLVVHLQTDPGYNPDNTVIMDFRLPNKPYNTPPKRCAFYQKVKENVQNLPGVTQVGLGSNPFGQTQSPYYVEHAPIPERGQEIFAEYNRVDPGYFSAMGIRLLEGRVFLPNDNADARPVVVVDQRFAQRWWPNQSAVGKRLQINRAGPDDNAPWAEVIGVVAHVKHYGVDQRSRESIFLPAYQHTRHGMTLVVRSQGDPLSLVKPIHEAVALSDPELPLYNIRTLQSVRDNRVAARHVMTTIMTGFAATALFLAALGIYGVTAYSVSQRTQEIGIRMALGACITDILRLVFGRGLRVAIPGLALGLLASIGLGWVIRSLLFGVTAWDPLTYLGVAILLTGVVLLACWIPARSAARIDPMEALRYE